MNTKRLVLRLIGATAILVATISGAHGADSISFEVGGGEKNEVLKLGAQWNWKTQWWRSNGTHIGGFWDLSLARWRGTQFQNVPGNTQNITVLGITPVFRFRNDNLKGFYAEFGIGAHLLSELYDNNGKQLSTSFQFGDHLGFGYVFSNNVDVAVSIQHYSNGGIKRPNDGVDFASVRITYPF